MSQRRKWIVFVSGASLTALAIWFIAAALWFGLERNRHGDVWEKYAQIRQGMLKSEVVTCFGVPPGNYCTGHVAICSTGQTEAFAAVDKCCSKSVWVFDEGLFEIGFDKNLKVEKKVASANMSG